MYFENLYKNKKTPKTKSRMTNKPILSNNKLKSKPNDE